MVMLILLIPALACTADIAPGSIREDNAYHQQWLTNKRANIDRVKIETFKAK